MAQCGVESPQTVYDVGRLGRRGERIGNRSRSPASPGSCSVGRWWKSTSGAYGRSTQEDDRTVGRKARRRRHQSGPSRRSPGLPTRTAHPDEMRTKSESRWQARNSKWTGRVKEMEQTRSLSTPLENLAWYQNRSNKANRCGLPRSLLDDGDPACSRHRVQNTSLAISLALPVHLAHLKLPKPHPTRPGPSDPVGVQHGDPMRLRRTTRDQGRTSAHTSLISHPAQSTHECEPVFPPFPSCARFPRVREFSQRATGNQRRSREHPLSLNGVQDPADSSGPRRRFNLGRTMPACSGSCQGHLRWSTPRPTPGGIPASSHSGPIVGVVWRIQ